MFVLSGDKGVTVLVGKKRGMGTARTAADGRPLRCRAVRDGSACGRPAPLPMVDHCAAGRCAMDRHAAGLHRCRFLCFQQVWLHLCLRQAKKRK